MMLEKCFSFRYKVVVTSGADPLSSLSNTSSYKLSPFPAFLSKLAKHSEDFKSVSRPSPTTKRKRSIKSMPNTGSVIKGVASSLGLPVVVTQGTEQKEISACMPKI